MKSMICSSLVLFAPAAMAFHAGAAPLGRRAPAVRMQATGVVTPTAPAAAPDLANTLASIDKKLGSMQNVNLVKTPAETFQALADKGVANSKMSVAKTMFASIMGGMFVGMGGLLSLSIAGAMPSADPGLVKFAFAALFPVNLLLVLQTGAQLFTGNTATLSSAFFEGKVTAKDVGRSWGLSYMGNIIGCGLFALMTAYTGLLSYGTAELAIGTVLKKCSGAFFPTVVKAILCNWLVCLAVFLSTQANDLAGKMVGIWFPISTFVAIGFEHSVANMFILPCGLLAGCGLSLKTVLLKNLIPVTIGNAIAGALIVGAGMSFAHGKLGQGK